MDPAIHRLNQREDDSTARQLLVGAYHNLLRQWSDT
jgi:predicted 2-oxoglutarate/Fe(II)-dependent dioxygenase YbiX